jgi:hypothetical protein
LNQALLVSVVVGKGIYCPADLGVSMQRPRRNPAEADRTCHIPCSKGNPRE